MKPRVLITGGAGFIGHHLVAGMLAEGWEVTVLDNESTGKRELVSGEASYILGDVRHDEDLDRAFEKTPEVVFHTAAQASNIRSFDNPMLDVEVNIGGTVKVVEHCLARGVPKLVYAGSMTAYGTMGDQPVAEDHPLNAISYYGIGKAAAERFVLATAQRPDLKKGFCATVFRMFNVYGPGQSLSNPYQGVLAIFIGNILRGEPCAVDSDGEQTRDFVYIDDVVRAWTMVARPGKADGAVINLGSGRRISVNRLVVETCLALGKDPEATPRVRRPERPGDQRHTLADIRRADEILGWTPRVDFPEGLKRTVAWAKEEAGGD